MQRRDDNLHAQRFQRLVDDHFEHVSVSPQLKRSILDAAKMRPPSWHEKLGRFLDREIVITGPQLAGALSVIFLVGGLYWGHLFHVSDVEMARYGEPQQFVTERILLDHDM